MNETNKEKSGRPATGTMLVNLERGKIMLSDLNPRKTFDEAAIAELAASIREQGLLQPVTVRPVMDGMYEVVCGARRLKAINQLGWTHVPVIIRELDDDAALDAMITENLQRKDVDPIEEAEAFRLLVAQGKSVEELAVRFGKSEKYIRGRLSLCNLTGCLQTALREDRLSLTAALKMTRLGEEQQTAFYVENLDYDEGEEPPHAGVSDVTLYIENESVSLRHQPFLGEDMSEDWLDDGSFHTCAGCPFNSASQSSLFPELCKSQACCLNPECLRSKQHAWQEWLLRSQHDRLLPAGEVPDVSHVVLITDRLYNDERMERLETLTKKYCAGCEILEYSKVSRCWGPATENTIECLNLADLVCNHSPWMRIRMPETSSDGSVKTVTRWEVQNRLDNLRMRHRDKVIEALDDVFKHKVSTARIADYLKSDDVLEGEEMMKAIVVNALYLCMSYKLAPEFDIRGKDLTETLLAWVREHSLRELLALAAYDIIAEGSKSQRFSLLRYLTFLLEPEAARQATEDIDREMQSREDKLLARLAEFDNDKQ